MPARFSHVSDQIYRGGEPSVEDLKILSDVYGIKHIISLDGMVGDKISQTVKNLGMEHTIIPISGFNSTSLIDFMRDNIAAMLIEKQPVYIHCKHGSDRTGMAIAMHRIKNQGWTPEQAMLEAKSFGFGDKLNPAVEELYTNAITNNDVNESLDGDVAALMRDQFNMGDVAPAFSPQQSFSVLDDYKVNGPDEFMANPPNSFKDPQKRKNIRKIIFEILSPVNMPQVGGKSDGSVPYGVGPTETGGFLF